MDNLKNIVVLKNLPSNLIEEALLILKPNQKIRNLEYVPKETTNVKETDYVVKEAEMVISSYLSKNDITGNKKIEKLEKKNKQLKIAIITMSVVIVIGALINIL